MGFFGPPASTGPAPVGALTDPTDISGLVVWFDFSDSTKLFDADSGGSTPSAGGAIGRIEDKSGNARNATQSTANNRPTYQTSVQNGLSIARFDGSNDVLGTANFTLPSTMTYFAVAARNWGSAAYKSIFSQNAGASTGINLLTSQVTAGDYNIYDMVIYSNGYNSNIKGTGGGSVVSAFTTNTFHIFSGYLSTSNTAMYIDKTQIAYTRRSYGTFYPLTLTSTSFRMGSNPLNEHWDRDIAEVFLYDTVLSDTNRQKAENYLATKWGIT